MKKVIFSLLIVFVLLWSCETVFAKGGGKDRGPGRQSKRAMKGQPKSGPRRAESNKSGGQSKEKQMRQRKQREIRRKERQKIPGITRKGEGKTAEKDTGRGKEHRQQLKALAAQIIHEEVKHRRRLARLKRIRELALEAGSTKTVERADKLLQKEQQRYDRKQQRMRGKKRKVLQLREKSLGKEAGESIKKAPTGERPKQQNKGKGKGGGKNKSPGKETDE